jgi:hypothetical protein
MTDSVNCIAFFEPRDFIVRRLYFPVEWRPKLKILLLFALFMAQAGGGAVSLFDGKTMKGWSRVGAVDWTVTDGALAANPSAQPTVAGADGKPTHPAGFLRSDASYANFDLSVEFHSEQNTNSGVFIRCAPSVAPSQTACYEVNISDSHATHPTGSIVGMHTTLPARAATAGKWSTLDIAAHGPHIVVKVDGKTVLDVKDEKFTAGAIALQAGGPNGPGPIRFRNVQIRPSK